MKVLEKVTKIKELKSELNSLKKEMGTDMFDYVMSEFRKRGFVESPKGEDDKRGLYSPETGINVRIGNISINSVTIQVTDMVDDGMNWGTAYKYIHTGPVSFVYIKESFDKFYQKTYTNRVNKLKEILAV
jgi:hypothetical protein